MSNKSAKYVEAFADLIIQQIKENKAVWQKPWKGGLIRQPHNPVTKTVYRGSNAFFLQIIQDMLGSSDPRWFTYKQAQSIGAQVKRGEKSTACRYLKKYGYRQVKDAQGKPLVNEKGEKVKECYPLSSPFIKMFFVFHASQIEGISMPDMSPTVPQWDIHHSAEQLIRMTGARVKLHKFDSAFYNPQEDCIFVPDKTMFDSVGDFYGTVLHELCHWTGHKDRLDRDIYHPFGSAEYAREELRAEIGAYILSSRLGFPFNPGRHVSNAAAWVKVIENDPYELFRATSDAHKIATFLIEKSGSLFFEDEDKVA